ncbi:response regulator [Candidatus Gracilibacteria bacterium]|nr:response regulator [Candidatus Gracilibacteria bacterium]
MRALSKAARTYLIALWAVALLLASLSLPLFWRETISLNQVLPALFFVIMLTIADLTASVNQRGRTVSIALAILIAGLTALNWPLFLIVVVLGTICAAIARDIPWWQAISLLAMRLVALTVGGSLVLINWRFAQQNGATLPYTTLPDLLGLVATGALIYAIERFIETGLIYFRDDGTLRRPGAATSKTCAGMSFLLTPLGGLLATLWQINGWAFALGIVPAVVVQLSLRDQTELAVRNAENQRLAAESANTNARLEQYNQILIALIVQRDLSKMLETLCEKLANMLGAANGWVVLTDQNQAPATVASYNLPIPPGSPGPHLVPWPQKYESMLSRQNVSLVTDTRLQTLAPTRALAEGQFWEALIFIPLVDEQRVLGALCLTFAEMRGLNESERRLLTIFARQAATVIDNARLLREVQESQNELIQSSKLAAVGTFAAGIAHEFNNLLAGMLGYAQLGLAVPDTETKNESLKVVVDTCKRGKSITGSLLTFARRRESHRELADLYEAVQGTLTLMELDIRKFNITIERSIKPVPLTVCDAGQISQVFLNLLTNARDAMNDGGTLLVSLDNDEHEIVLSVRDTGCGIPDTIRDKIFEPFVTTKGALGGSETPGTGLGLSVSYGIVKSHNGKFEVDSLPGQGTTMTVRLPIVTESEVPQLPTPELENGEIAGLRLLLVDDDEAVGTSLRSLLMQAGHSVTFVGDGASALQQYRSTTYDIVLSDMSMPGMNGIDLLQALRVHDDSARVIIFTGQAMEEQVKSAYAAGASTVLRKPVEVEEMLNAIKVAWLQRSSVHS